MGRYFFDFDDVSDEFGIEMPSADEAFSQAVASMPEYVTELLSRDKGKAEMTCTIRDSDGAAMYRITMSMRLQDASGATIEAPFARQA